MRETDISQGDHAIDFDIIAAGELGSSPETPFVEAPDIWDESGVPYGAWCKCSCGVVGRSTFIFDFYRQPDNSLRCERCVLERS